MKIGYNVNGLWHAQYHPIGVRLPVTLVVNNIGLARKILDHNPSSMVIHRNEIISGVKDEGYSNWHKQISPKRYSELISTPHGHSNKDIWLYVMNEPNVPDIASFRNMLRFSEVAGRELISMGYKIVILNTPPASWREDWIEAGAADALLSWAGQNRDRVIIGYHDYSEFHLVLFGNGERNYERFDDPNYVSPANWASKVNPSTMWHIGHITKLIRRARYLNVNPRFGCTEINYGEVSDPNTMLQKIRLGEKFPPAPIKWMNEGKPIHNGQHTLHGYWNYVYPQWSWENVVIEQLKWYSRIIGEWGVEFATLYGFGFGGEHGQDYWNDNKLHEMLIEWQANASKQMKIKSAGRYRVNVRELPTLNSRVIGSISSSASNIIYYESVGGWHKILYNNRIGYVSERYSILVD